MSAENEDQKPVGYGVAFPLSVLPPFYLIYRERSPPWKLGLESQQDHPWFVVNIIPFLYPTNLLLVLSRRWYILLLPQDYLLLPLREELLLVVVEWKRGAK